MNPVSESKFRSKDRFVRVPSRDLLSALGQLVITGQKANRGGAEALMLYAREQDIALDQCWGLVQSGKKRVNPVCLVMPNKGRTALLFVSEPSGSHFVDRLGHLIERILHLLDPEEIHIAQALLTSHEKESEKAFLSAGFTRLADLSYLEKRIGTPEIKPEMLDWPTGYRVEMYRPELEDDFKAALADTYEQTLDCPALCGLREIDDVFEGHKCTGYFDPSLWTILYCNDEPAGVLLLNPMSASPKPEWVELVYIGISAKHRGQRLGQLILTHGLSLLAERGVSKLTLAVDESNGPAIAMYRDLGFYRTDQRVALIYAMG